MSYRYHVAPRINVGSSVVDPDRNWIHTVKINTVVGYIRGKRGKIEDNNHSQIQFTQLF